MAITHELMYWDDQGEDQVFCNKVQCHFMGNTSDGFSICTIGPIPRLASDNTCVIDKTLEISIWEYEDDDEAEEEEEEEEDYYDPN